MVNDQDCSDWGEAVAFQGKKVHDVGYYCNNQLSSEPIVYPNIPDGKLMLTTRMKANANPIKNPCTPPIGIAATNAAGILAMIFFHPYVHWRSGTEEWLDYDREITGYTQSQFMAEPYTPQMLICEKFQRWWWDGKYFVWRQASDIYPFYNYRKKCMVHDPDYHHVRAGWQFDTINEWKDFTWDVGYDFRLLCDLIWEDYGRFYNDWYVLFAKIRSVAVAVECIGTKYEAECDCVSLKLY